MSKEISTAPRYSVVPDGQKPAPTTSEQFIEQQLELYLQSAPHEQQKVMRSEWARKGVLRKLSEFAALMPILERVSEVTDAEANKLGLEGGTSLKNVILRDRIASACQIAVLEEMTKNDTLTGLANRRGYNDEVEKAMELAKRTGLPLWCLMMDVDDFRHVNNDYGHLAGDQVLKEIGRRLREQTRASDFVGRFGGEEFIALIYSDEAGVSRALHRIVDTIGSEPFIVRTKHGVKKLRITISAGGSRFKAEEDPKTGMEERADKSLYLAKNLGKNQAFLDDTRVDPGNLEQGPDGMSAQAVEGNLAIGKDL